MTLQESATTARRGRPPKVKTANLLDQSSEASKKPLEGDSQVLRDTGQGSPQSDPREFPAPTDISEKLFENNVNLAYMIARRWEKKTRIPFDTLKPPALIGLLRAARKYNPNLLNPKNGAPYALSSHSVPFIDGEIKHFLRKNHASGVTFPEKWRDSAPKVRRLISEGLTHQQVGEQTGFTADEVREIVEAQSCTQELNLDARGHAHYDPELSDDEVSCPEFLEAMQIAGQAWIALDWSLQQIMLKSWEGYGRRNRQELATRSFDRFSKLARAISLGHELPRGIRQPTLDLLVTESDGTTHALSSAQEITGALEQMALTLSD